MANSHEGNRLTCDPVLQDRRAGFVLHTPMEQHEVSVQFKHAHNVCYKLCTTTSNACPACTCCMASIAGSRANNCANHIPSIQCRSSAWSVAKYRPSTQFREAHACLPLPRCVLMLMYRAVPVRLLCSLYGMWLPVSGSMYSLLRPKSIMWIVLSPWSDRRPTRKFSGLMSR